MNDYWIREIEMEYEAQRARNHAEENRRQTHAAELDPAIGVLIAGRIRLFHESARQALDHPREASAITRALTQRMIEIQAQLKERLTRCGLPEDYLQPVFQCADCHDCGFVGEPVHERCGCYEKKLRAKAMGRGGHGLDTSETFEAYDAGVYDAQTPLEQKPAYSQRTYMARLSDLCQAYAQAYPKNEQRNMLMTGASGLGKTYLLNCIGNRLHSRGVDVLKVTAYQFTDRMRRKVFDGENDAFDALLDVPVLLLDDLGVEPLYNNLTIEHLYTLLNERGLHRLHTLISTNLSLKNVTTHYNERFASRLFDSLNTDIVLFLGRDVRLR